MIYNRMRRSAAALIWVIIVIVIVAISAVALATLLINFPYVELTTSREYERVSSGIYRGIFLANNVPVADLQPSYDIPVPQFDTDTGDAAKVTISISYNATSGDYTIIAAPKIPTGRSITVVYNGAITSWTLSWN